jgi:rsbT antagonist protein RsbS
MSWTRSSTNPEQISSMRAFLDAQTVVVGMQPPTRSHWLSWPFLAGIRTALNVDKGMTLLRTALNAETEEPGEARHDHRKE